MPDYIKKPDMEFRGQMETLANVLAASFADYGLLAADVMPITNALELFVTRLNQSEAAKAAALTAVANKDEARDALEALVRPMVRQIQERPAVTDEARLAAGIPIRDTVRTSSAPIAPLGLVATLASPRSANLAWNSNGNASGVDYVIEKRVNNAGEWMLVDVVRGTRKLVSGLTAGVRVDFRIRARRGSQTSDPSNTASIYAD
jgi:hypothetical protein